MTDQQRMQEHWTQVYSTKDVETVSWHQAEPKLSLEMIASSADPPARVLDVGGGTSFLVDELLKRGYRPGVLDISDVPLALVRSRLGPAATGVEWLVGDIREFALGHSWDVWHDRAVFHFLTEADDRLQYRQRLLEATMPGSGVVIATFAPDGPEKCSGLPTVRYSPENLSRELGMEFELLEAVEERHRTPTGNEQPFVYCRFRRT
jgi:SAM-dependent methyltransferase